MTSITNIIDRISGILASATMFAIVLLIGTMAYEVVMRRLLDAPTIWAFDVSYMLNGFVFIGAAGFVYRNDGHIRVTFLSERMTARRSRLTELLFLLVLFIPLTSWLGLVSMERAYTAFVKGEIERVSVWAPQVWPYYAALAFGLVGLALQSIAEALKCWISITRGNDRVSGSSNLAGCA